MQSEWSHWCAIGSSPMAPGRVPGDGVGGRARSPRRSARSGVTLDRAGDSETAQGQLSSQLPRAAPDGREGAGRGDPGSLRAGRFHALGRRSGQGHGRWRHVEEPGQPSLRRDRRAGERLSEPSAGGGWPYLRLDATYLKVREGGRIISRAVIVAVAVNEDGKREVLGVTTGPSEAETFWTELLRSLADRGLRGVKLVIADDHKGLRAAARRVFNASHQRCRVHWMRNALAHAPAKQRGAVAAMLKTIFAQESKADAEAQSHHAPQPEDAGHGAGRDGPDRTGCAGI